MMIFWFFTSFAMKFLPFLVSCFSLIRMRTTLLGSMFELIAFIRDTKAWTSFLPILCLSIYRIKNIISPTFLIFSSCSCYNNTSISRKKKGCLKNMAGPERKIELDIIKKITEIGGYAEKYQAGAGTGKGRPDLRLVYNDGICTAVEVKRKDGNYPTPVQIKNLYLLAKNHARAVIANDADNIVSYMKEPNVEHEFLNKVYLTDEMIDNLTVKQAREIWTKRPTGCSIVQIVPK